MMTIRIILQDLYKVVWQWLKDVPNNYQNHLMAKENNFLMSRADKIPLAFWIDNMWKTFAVFTKTEALTHWLGPVVTWHQRLPTDQAPIVSK